MLWGPSSCRRAFAWGEVRRGRGEYFGLPDLRVRYCALSSLLRVLRPPVSSPRIRCAFFFATEVVRMGA
jgi:hypothetical protein